MPVRRLLLFLIISLFAIMAAGCEFGSTKESEFQQEEASIKAVVWNEREFNQQYASLFSIKYPKIDVQVINTNVLRNTEDLHKNFEALVANEKPDIIVFPNADMFEWWANEGNLYNLDSLIKSDKFDIENINSNVVDYLKFKGAGNLYGLSPTFNNKVLYYNKDLFDKYQIDYPHNGMSWDEVLNIAARFPTDQDADTKVYGYYPNATFAFDWIELIGRSLQLTYLDEEGGTLTFNQPGWKHVFENVLTGYSQGYVYRVDGQSATSESNQEINDFYKKNLFTVGRAAMTINDASYISEMNLAEQVSKITLPNWDIVSLPALTTAPEETTEFTTNEIFAIAADSPNIRAAWELIKYANSAEASQINATLDTNNLMSRTEHNKEMTARNMEPFYLLKPAKMNLPAVKLSTRMQLSQLLENEVKAMLKGEKTLEQALDHLQLQAQESLD
ncbi:ABC transporter substrate-binding protein [Paenibacillus eucommiae]|uniref:Multiple sugar transport system substrate-binding protein n=1 Tax=Paenibacillus eucommiae TaxID=1355755 RepID=A0ABS4IWA2_9BACL|nr:extracellular solute-binding protein [Paenibacillus eucommiae]MBP1991868.1 multiple sugar transport system substrate-binding protein [Paenibacillus eucommiae]